MNPAKDLWPTNGRLAQQSAMILLQSCKHHDRGSDEGSVGFVSDWIQNLIQILKVTRRRQSAREVLQGTTSQLWKTNLTTVIQSQLQIVVSALRGLTQVKIQIFQPVQVLVETDLSKVSLQLNMYQALVRGYLAAAGEFLTPTERNSLPLAGMVMTYECGIRFLTDYLQGDTYFKTSRPQHNLDRCRSQFKLVESMETQRSAMDKCE